jgi:phage-related minor tail protein
MKEREKDFEEVKYQVSKLNSKGKECESLFS